MEESEQAIVAEGERAMQYALRVLGYRARSRAELRGRLERKGFAARVTEQTLERLTELGLLDDGDFAHAWVSARRGFGPARLKQELRQKGIARELAEEVIVTDCSADAEYASAWQVACRALRNTVVPLTRDEVLRVRRLLLRRGFSYEVCGGVCSRLQDRLNAEGDWLE